MSIAAVAPLESDLAAAYSTELRLTAGGRLVDFLEPGKSRPNKPEERVRQVYARKLHYDYGYPTSVMVIEASIQIGSQATSADIVVYRSEAAARRRDQSRVRLVVETKAPDRKSGLGQLQSYIFASSAEGGVWINATDAPVYWRRDGETRPELREWPNIPRDGESWDGDMRHKKNHPTGGSESQYRSPKGGLPTRGRRLQHLPDVVDPREGAGSTFPFVEALHECQIGPEPRQRFL